MESAESPLSDAWGHPDADLLATPRKAVTALGSLRHRTPSRWHDHSGQAYVQLLVIDEVVDKVCDEGLGKKGHDGHP